MSEGWIGGLRGLGLCCDYIGIAFGLHGTTLGSLWYYFGITLGEWAVPSVCFVGGYYGSYYFINIRHLLTFVVLGVLIFVVV